MIAARSKAREPAGPPAAPRTAVAQPEAAAPVSNLALQQALRTGALRAKLTVGSPDDPAEAEADRVAEQITQGGPCACGGTCSQCSGGIVRRQPSAPGAAAARTAAFVPGAGQPLSRDLRAFFEPRLGASLGAVRLHDDQRAAATARAISANAFTVGNDIGFAPGQLAPETLAGRKLLAHELTHVVQNGATLGAQRANPPVGGVRRAASARVSQPWDAAEQEADAAAGAVMRGETVATPRETGAPISRDGPPFTPAPAAGVSPPLPGPPPPLPPRGPAPAGQQPKDELNDPWKMGSEVSRPGLIQTPDGANLHPDPSLTTTTERLPISAKVWVERSVPGFYFVVSDTGSSGFVQQERVTLDLPDPAARLYTIQPQETALDIVKKFYKAEAQGWGQDERFFVNVLVFVNQDKQRNGISKPDPEGGWDTTKTIAGRTIWIPSLGYATALKGKVSSGSLSYETWSTIKDVAVAVGDFLAGSVSFIAGLLHGAFESVWDTLVGLVDLVGLVWKFLKSLLTANLLSDLRALWDEVSKINVHDLVEAGLDYLDKQWNDPSIWKRWHFRGWLIGYAIAEIVMLFFSEGILTAVKVSAKAGKLAAIIDKFPSVARFAKRAEAAAKDFKEAKVVSGAIKTLSAARDWAVKILKIPFTILGDLTEEAITRLKRLPTWAQEIFADLSDAAKIALLGCASPCKVELEKIAAFLRELAAKGAVGAKTLTTAEEVLEALGKLPGKLKLNLDKIGPYLKSHPALMKAIEKARLTDADFEKLAEFLTGADASNANTAYETFSKYLIRVVPAKLGPDIKGFNDLVAEILKADVKQGAALKGHMFEAFIRLHVPEFAGKTFQRVSFRAADGTLRTADRFFAGAGELWEVKHQILEQVPIDQARAYLAAIGSKTTAGAEIKSVHYLFPTEDAAKLNAKIKDLGVQVWYIAPPAKLTPL